MLAQNFKTPADLKITNAEFDSLVKVLGMLERGEIMKGPKRIRPWSIDNLPAPTLFDMHFEAIGTKCGTVCCFLGWAKHVSQVPVFNRSMRFTAELHELTFPQVPGALDCNDPAKGAIALRNYLTHGEARWDEAMAS